MNAPAKNVQRAANESDHHGFPRELHELVERRCRRLRDECRRRRGGAAFSVIGAKRGLGRALRCGLRRRATPPAAPKVKAGSCENSELRRL